MNGKLYIQNIVLWQNEKSQEPSIEKFEHPRTKQKIDFEDDLKNKELLNI